MKDKLEYLISSFDMYFVFGKSPIEAWHAALVDYVYVYHSKDKSDSENPVLARAAKAALDALSDLVEDKEEVVDVLHKTRLDMLNHIFNYYKNEGKSAAEAWELARQQYAIIHPDMPQPSNENPFIDEESNDNTD